MDYLILIEVFISQSLLCYPSVPLAETWIFIDSAQTMSSEFVTSLQWRVVGWLVWWLVIWINVCSLYEWSLSVGYLGGWLVGYLVSWWVVWLFVGYFVGCLVSWLVGFLGSWLFGLMVGWLNGWLVALSYDKYWFDIGLLFCLVVGWHDIWLVGWKDGWLVGLMYVRMVGRLLVGCLIDN